MYIVKQFLPPSLHIFKHVFKIEATTGTIENGSKLQSLDLAFNQLKEWSFSYSGTVSEDTYRAKLLSKVIILVFYFPD